MNLRGEFEKWNWDMKMKNDLQNEIGIWFWKLMNLRNEIEFGKLIWEIKLNLGNEFEKWNWILGNEVEKLNWKLSFKNEFKK